MPRRRKKGNEVNWSMLQKQTYSEQVSAAMAKLKEQRKGKKFIYIKHPIKGLIEKEIRDGDESV